MPQACHVCLICKTTDLSVASRNLIQAETQITEYYTKKFLKKTLCQRDEVRQNKSLQIKAPENCCIN